VRLRYVVEREHAVAELGEEVGAEGHYGPEWKLRKLRKVSAGWMRAAGTYDGYDIGLELLGEGCEAEEGYHVYLGSGVSREWAGRSW